MNRCYRCGKEKDDMDILEVEKSVYRLCQRCIDVFYRRFTLFMAGG